MNRKRVEERDRELVRKFRSVVHLKAHQRRRYRAVAWIAGPVVALLAAIVIVAGGRFREPVTAVPPDAPVSPGPVATAADSAVSRSPGKTSAESVPVAEVAGETAASGEPVPAPSMETGRESGAAFPVKESRSKRAKQAIGDIRITRIVACRRVEDRRYVSPQSEFSLRKDARPDVWIWMEVETARQALPRTVRHVYYHNGRRHAEVVLDIRFSRMRTWSHIALNGPAQAGKWHVEAVSETGEILSHVDFTVVP